MADQIAVHLDDLRTLLADDPADRVDVRCRACDYRVVFRPDVVDPPRGMFMCEAPGWRCSVSFSWRRCFFEAPSSIGHWFYVHPPMVTAQHKLIVVDDGKTAYHTLVSTDDDAGAKLARVQQLRQRSKHLGV